MEHTGTPYIGPLTLAEARRLHAEADLEIDKIPPPSRFRRREQTALSREFDDPSFRTGSSSIRTRRR